MPDLSRERMASGLVCGIDEVGRGPWAGPVVAAAVILGVDYDAMRRLPDVLLDGLDDSKRLSPARREKLYGVLHGFAQSGSIRIGVAAASVLEIDRLNILAATHLAMARAVAALGVAPEIALVDGNRKPPLPCRVETIVGGDGLSLSIAAASVVAKVIRDRLMSRLAARYREFGWQQNMGYGTHVHREALLRHGPTPHHRKSFAPVRQHALPLSH